MKRYKVLVEIIAENYDCYEDSTFSSDFDEYVEASNEHSNELKIVDFKVIEENTEDID